MPTIEDLRQTHPEFGEKRRARLRALYNGGEEFEELLNDFLPARPQEPSSRYALRKREAVYRNYVGPIIDYFTALLFSGNTRVEAKSESGEVVESINGYYTSIRNDCDRNGSDLDDKVKSLLTTAMVEGKAWVLVKHPSGEAPINRAKFELSGIGDSWIESLDTDSVIDWENDETGALAWAVVYEKTAKRSPMSGSRQKIVETWRHITTETIDTYQIEYDEKKKPTPKTEVKLIESITHRYQCVPLVCLDLPVGLWVASRLETPQLAHFRLSNAQTWSMAATCYAMPVFKVKSPEAFKKSAMGAGYGFFIHPDEAIEWTAPDAAPFVALSSEIKDHKDEIYRIAHTMSLGVDNGASTVGRSGESKAMDARATSVVLLAYARLIKEKIEVIFDMFSRARGDRYVWAVDGLDDFVGGDLLGLVDILDKVETAGGIPSDTFNTELKTNLAESMLPDLPLAQKSIIRKEIAAGIKEAKNAESRMIEIAERAGKRTPEGFGGN